MTLQRVYIGTFTQEIVLCHFDSQNGRLEKVDAFDGGPSPAFLAFSAGGDFLYCVNEVDHFGGQAGGGISAFQVDRKNGRLTFINSQISQGQLPCYISLDHSGKVALAANYSGGNVAVFPVGAGGRLGAASDCVQHSGQGQDAQRQNGPHPHSVRVCPGSQLVWAADLGLDRICIYNLDVSAGRLNARHPPALELHARAGPRHFDFHPNGRWAYVLNELDSTLSVVGMEQAAEIQSISTVPAGFSGVNWPADVHVHAGGRFVMASNRGHDSLALFAIDPGDGRLELVEIVPSRGKWPVNFGFDPSGRWLIAANQNSGSLTVLACDAGTGKLRATGGALNVPAPACVIFAPSA